MSTVARFATGKEGLALTTQAFEFIVQKDARRSMLITGGSLVCYASLSARLESSGVG
jgi:hypothetical protein